MYYEYESFNIGLSGNYLSEYETESKDGVIRDYVGEVLYPEYRVALNANLNVSESLDLFAQLTYLVFLTVSRKRPSSDPLMT